MKFLKDREELKVIAAYIVVCILWGSTYLAIRIGVSEFPPGLFAGIRFLTAGLIVCIYAWYRKMEFPHNIKDVRRISIVGFLLLLGCNGLVVWVEQWVHSGVTALLLATIPLFMAVIDTLLPGGSRIGLGGWLGLLLGFGGVALLVLSGSQVGAIDVAGTLILLLASLFWAAGSVYSGRFKPSGCIVTHIGIQMLAGGMGLTLVGLIMGEASRVQLTLRGFGALAYLIVFGSIIGYSCYIYVLQKWPSAKAGTYAYINPVVAVLLGALILREPLSEGIVVSTAVILGGVIMVQLSKVPVRPQGADSSLGRAGAAEE